MIDHTKIDSYLADPRQVELRPINKETWQTLIRKSRRRYYNSLNKETQKSFLKTIWEIRIKTDYQGYRYYKEKLHGYFI